MSLRKNHIIINGIELKNCSKCQLNRSLENFRKYARKWDGLYPSCKECSSKKDKIIYEKVKNIKILRQKIKYSQRDKNLKSEYARKAYLKRKESLKKRAQDLKRRMLKINADKTYKITAQTIKSLLNKFGKICFYCKDELTSFTIDHVIPLCRGGDNSFDNLVISCKQCNSSKGKKLLSEWLSH